MTTPLPAAQRQFLVSVTGIPDFWSAKTGGDVTSATTDVYNGGQLQPMKLAAAPVTANITITRPFVPQRDQAIIKDLTTRVGQWRTTVSVQPTDADLVPLGNPDVYSDALLVSLHRADVDASSGKEGTTVLEFAVSRIS